MSQPRARFAYFMIRVHSPLGEHLGSVSGMVERLGTGEKRAFQSGEELLQLLTAWSEKPTRSSGAGAEESQKMAQEDT